MENIKTTNEIIEYRSALEEVLDKYFPKIEEEGEEKRLNKRSEALMLYTEAVLLHEKSLSHQSSELKRKIEEKKSDYENASVHDFADDILKLI